MICGIIILLNMNDLIYKELVYEVVGLCFEIHNFLGPGFAEVVYKDALEYELNKVSMSFKREKEYTVIYKGIILPHKFYADFVVEDQIILEIKAVKTLSDEFYAQTINYLKVSGLKLGLVISFGEKSLMYKRVIV
jgi:GxxExxY protein